jgi:hypothetical protein
MSARLPADSCGRVESATSGTTANEIGAAACNATYAVLVCALATMPAQRAA